MKSDFGYFLLCILIMPGMIYSQTTYFIKYKNDIPQSRINEIILSQNLSGKSSSLNKNAGIKIDYFAKGLALDDDDLSRIIKVNLPHHIPDDDLIKLKSSPEIDYVQKSITYKIDFLPDDKNINDQWALSKIMAFDAWNITQGSDSTIIGIIDTGIDYLHPDLMNKIYINNSEDLNDNGILDPGDINNIDDDGNGYIDDVIGWDFTDRQFAVEDFDSTIGDYLTWDNNPFDENGHGTYVAGIAGAHTNNAEGIAGTAPNAKLLNIRAFDPTGNGEEDDVASGILYAIRQGAKVINMSFGDYSFSYVLRDVIRYAYKKNVVLVASSGNSSSDQPHYPSGYSEVISVGASTSDDYVASFSNYGSTIDMVAPGSEILTTAKDNSYISINGTSASAPFVSAASALLLSLQNFSNEEIKQILKSTCDDINSPGWDLRSGAGRLNLFNALRVAAPAKIKINFPFQDFTTIEDSIQINATILSPYFDKYELHYGTGLNPENWINLITDGSYQFENKNIFTIDISDWKDTVYTLRLFVYQNNGKNTEERINFHIRRTPPKMTLISLGQVYYGENPTILAEIVTDYPTVVKMHYRPKGNSSFNHISLDGFLSNNSFVKKLHYGFLPVNSVIPGEEYEIYFEAENLAGINSILKNEGSYFNIESPASTEMIANFVQPFSLPPGIIFKDAVNFSNSNYSEVILQDFSTNKYNTSIYKYEDDNFIKIDSMISKYPKEFGDFNKDGKFDLLYAFGRKGYLDEQESSGSTKLISKYADSSSSFYPILAKDIDEDGITECISIYHSNSLAVWKVKSDLTLDTVNVKILENFSLRENLGNGSNEFLYTNAAIADCNNDGKKEIWAVDSDGDILNYIINAPGDYIKGDTIHTDYLSETSIIAAGNYDGKPGDEIAVLLHSYDVYSVAPFHLLIVFNTLNNNFNVIYQEIFIDPSDEIKSSFNRAENSLRLIDIDNDNKDEIILFVYPYAYIIKENKIIFYDESFSFGGLNSVFGGDLNKNGVIEISFPDDNGIKFLEFNTSDITKTPSGVEGFSLSEKTVQLNWNGAAQKFYIFKGTEENHISLFDSSEVNYFYDNIVDKNCNYYYQIQAFDSQKNKGLSNKSKVITVYSHLPAKAISVEMNSSKSVLIKFSEKIKNTIESLTSFYIPEIGYPQTISAASTDSYLLNFSERFKEGEYKLIVKDLKDFYNSPVQEDTLKFKTTAEITEDKFYITAFSLVSPYELKVQFNLDLDKISAENLSNYKFEPYNEIISANVSSEDKNTIFLKSKNPVGSIGREYQLKLNNVFSADNLDITDGAGSYIVISSFAENLADMYIYPNPAKLHDGQNKITFANLTQNSEIIIFNISGDKIITLEDRSGRGGIDWDLKDRNGNLINTGVYIFKVIALDLQKNELEEKLGKFAVIK